MRRFYCPALSLFPGQDNKKLPFSPFLNWPLKRAWREGNAQDASDDYSSGVVAGLNLATLVPEINLALISLGQNIIQLSGTRSLRDREPSLARRQRAGRKRRNPRK